MSSSNLNASSTGVTDQIHEPETKRIKLEDNQQCAIKTIADSSKNTALTPANPNPANPNPAIQNQNQNPTTAPVKASAPMTSTIHPQKKPTGATTSLQQQIQAQLQQQLQAQLQAAAAKGQQANITPEQIQAQAQAMVQAAAQAQAVVSAAKSRGDGLVPMNSQQITALSQIQAQAIVNARPQTALLASATPTVDKDGKAVRPTQAQIQHQITLQAQALVHAHTQAQIAAGIYKGDTVRSPTTGDSGSAANSINIPMTSTAGQTPIINSKSGSSTVSSLNSQTVGSINAPLGSTGVKASTTVNPLLPSLTSAQIAQQNRLATRQTASKDLMLKNHSTERASLHSQLQQANLASAPTPESQAAQEIQIKNMEKRHNAELAALQKAFSKELSELHSTFRKQHAAAEFGGMKVSSLPNNGTVVPTPSTINTAASRVVGVAPLQSASKTGTSNIPPSLLMVDDSATVTSSTSPAFLEKLSGTLNRFWTNQLHQMRQLGTTVQQTEQDFKNHNDLPLARIKRIMKSDEDVRMISAEAPVLFAKACEMFILELTLRSWSYSENNKRRTLQKEDIKEAIQRTDIFDFLVDVIH